MRVNTSAAPRGTTASKHASIALFKDEWLRASRQTAETPLSLPAGDFQRATLTLNLAGPNGNADWWDKLGHFSIVRKDGTQMELARFITPYRVGGEWKMDVTELLPLLKEAKAIRVFIATFADEGPEENNVSGRPVDKGDGWLVDARLDLETSPGERTPTKAFAFAREELEFGNPAADPSRTLTFNLQDGVEDASLDLLVTGHGEGATLGAGEWGPETNEVFVTIDGKRHAKRIWREDCDESHGVRSGLADPDYQFSPSYTAPRVGWCPGADVEPWHLELGPLGPGEHTVRFEPQPYLNEKREENLNPPPGGQYHRPPYWTFSGVLTTFDKD
jgi:hypothetical protein